MVVEKLTKCKLEKLLLMQMEYELAMKLKFTFLSKFIVFRFMNHTTVAADQQRKWEMTKQSHFHVDNVKK